MSWNKFESYYQAINPEINYEFPVAKDENDYENQLIDGYHKVLRGFRVLNELCEWSILAIRSGRLPADLSLSSSDNSLNHRNDLFDSFAHVLAEDVATVTKRLLEFRLDQNIDLMSLYTEVIDYLQLYFEGNRLWGDFEDRIGGALIHLAMLDSKVENELYVAWILDLNDPASERSNDYYSYVFKNLNGRILSKDDEIAVLAERVYAGPLVVSIVATDDDVQFLVDGWEEDRQKGEWDDDYKYGRIYRNDKQTPGTKEEWLDLMAPEEGSAFRLGTRGYKTIEEAIKGETNWLSTVGHFFR